MGCGMMGRSGYMYMCETYLPPASASISTGVSPEGAVAPSSLRRRADRWRDSATSGGHWSSSISFSEKKSGVERSDESGGGSVSQYAGRSALSARDWSCGDKGRVGIWEKNGANRRVLGKHWAKHERRLVRFTPPSDSPRQVHPRQIHHCPDSSCLKE